jgi:hypothetical protein
MFLEDMQAEETATPAVPADDTAATEETPSEEATATETAE